MTATINMSISSGMEASTPSEGTGNIKDERERGGVIKGREHVLPNGKVDRTKVARASETLIRNRMEQLKKQRKDLSRSQRRRLAHDDAQWTPTTEQMKQIVR